VLNDLKVTPPASAGPFILPLAKEIAFNSFVKGVPLEPILPDDNRRSVCL